MNDAHTYTWPQLTQSLLKGEHLGGQAVRWAMGQVMDGAASPIALGGFLVALQARGVTVEELDAFALTALEHSTRLEAPEGAVDIVGTGGDGAHTVNISTMASLVIGGAGYPVVKHGNRAASSKSGAADCLAELGISLDLTPDEVAEVMARAGIAFCFAQTFHPSMRHAALTRKELSIPTVFNVLGPLTNPARVRANAIGCAFADLAPVMAGVYARRGHSALVFRGRDGLDELSIATASDVWEVRNGAIRTHVIEPEYLGIDKAPLEALRGGDPQYNAQVARDVFGGATGPIRDAVVLNAAAGIVAARAESHKDDQSPFMDRMIAAAREAERVLDDGAAAALLEKWSTASAAVVSERA